MDSTELLEASYVLDPFDIESEVTHVPEVAVAVSDFIEFTELLEAEYVVEDPLEAASEGTGVPEVGEITASELMEVTELLIAAVVVDPVEVVPDVTNVVDAVAVSEISHNLPIK